MSDEFDVKTEVTEIVVTVGKTKVSIGRHPLDGKWWMDTRHADERVGHIMTPPIKFESEREAVDAAMRYGRAIAKYDQVVLKAQCDLTSELTKIVDASLWGDDA